MIVQAGTEPYQARGVALFMASGTSNAWDARAGRRPPVGLELEAIFAPLPRREPQPEPLVSSAFPAPRGRRRRLWIVVLAAIAMIALIVGLAFLAPVVRQAQPRQERAPLVRQASPPHANMAVPLPAPRLPTAPVMMRPPAPSPQARVQPKPLVPATSHRRAPLVHRGSCPRFATEAWCLHGTIMTADDRLREAYDAAVRAGVSRDTLIDIRSDWKRLRGRANHDPEALIRGYALLTQELRGEMARMR